jgi:hypothetical protein
LPKKIYFYFSLNKKPNVMIANAILHDRRLTGRPPGSTQGFRLYRTNGNISLNWTLSHIAGDARGHGGIGELHIMCHGLEDIVAVNNQSQVRGGFGLELGREGVDLSNVAVFSALAGLVQIITIHACATADTVPGVSNGRQLCREIAARTRAEVIAATRTQEYTYYTDGSGRIDFGGWEGPVFRFSPDGSVMPHFA